MCVSVCLPDPVSSSLVQSVMSMASSHSQHSHISTDTMSSMSGSYLAGGEGEPGADHGGAVEAEDQDRDAFMESRGPSQQDGVRNPGSEGWLLRISALHYLLFVPGVFPGAEGEQLLSGCGGAGLRGDERPRPSRRFHLMFQCHICVFCRGTTSPRMTAPLHPMAKVDLLTIFHLHSRLLFRCKMYLFFHLFTGQLCPASI